MDGETLHIAIDGRDMNIDRFEPTLREFAVRKGLNEQAIFKITLMIDEIVSNIIQYGYDEPGRHSIDVHLTVDREVCIRIEDDGRPFNPLEAPEPELHIPIEKRKKPIGGMGIHLTKCCSGQLQYERSEGRNILTMKGGAGVLPC